MANWNIYRWSCYGENDYFLGFVNMTIDGEPTAQDETQALHNAKQQGATLQTVRVGMRTLISYNKVKE